MMPEKTAKAPRTFLKPQTINLKTALDTSHLLRWILVLHSLSLPTKTYHLCGNLKVSSPGIRYWISKFKERFLKEFKYILSMGKPLTLPS